jgi:ribosomal protein S18 acetylase RimI-like enzyme
VGGRLFDEVMDWMAAQGPPDIWIGVWSENLGAQRFYARRGFEKVGEYGFPVGKTVDRRGKSMTMLLKGPVEAWFES